MIDYAIGRLLTALAVGFIAVGLALGVEAWMFNDPARAMPALTRVGFALWVASGVYSGLRWRAARREREGR